jgi:hypothetical protein
MPAVRTATIAGRGLTPRRIKRKPAQLNIALIRLITMTLRKKLAVAAVVGVAAVVIAIPYANGIRTPDRQVAALVEAKDGQLSVAQINAELTQRLPPGPSQQTLVAYLNKHGATSRDGSRGPLDPTRSLVWSTVFGHIRN